jgi:hypothetical protein
MSANLKTPLPLGEREGPAAKRWEGEGMRRLTNKVRSHLHRALTLPLLAQWAPPSPLKGEGL